MPTTLPRHIRGTVSELVTFMRSRKGAYEGSVVVANVVLSVFGMRTGCAVEMTRRRRSPTRWRPDTPTRPRAANSASA